MSDGWETSHVLGYGVHAFCISVHGDLEKEDTPNPIRDMRTWSLGNSPEDLARTLEDLKLKTPSAQKGATVGNILPPKVQGPESP